MPNGLSGHIYGKESCYNKDTWVLYVYYASSLYTGTIWTSDFSYARAYDASTYQSYLQANLQGFIETNLVKAATNQKLYYDQHAKATTTFVIGDPFWLSIPDAGKLSSHWKDNRKFQKKNPYNI